MIRRMVYRVGVVGLWICSAVSGFGQTARTRIDSTFWMLSLPEIQSYRAYYVQELEALQEEKRNLIERGTEDGERLLKMQPAAETVDEILIRLADLYYYKEKEDYFNRMKSYDDLLAASARGEAAELPDEPRLNCKRSLEIYQRIIDEFPQSELVDDAIYTKGFLFEEMGQSEKANQIYVHLIDAYPESPYVPEAYMRMGEQCFNPPLNDLQKAITFYNQVLNYRNSSRYDEALYKLGWSYYRLSQYPEAISYFTTLVENSKAMEKYDPVGATMRTDLSDEALEYIAISFIDFGGPDRARDYLASIQDPLWGADVLEKLGDVYMQEKEDYPNAIAAYEKLIDLSPSSHEAPEIQKKIVDCYSAVNDEADAFNARQSLFENYRANGVWWSETADEKAKLRAYRLTEQALRENFNAIVKKAEASADRGIYEQAAEVGRTYLESFPEDLYAYMIRWNIGLILDTKLHQCKEALQEYLTISMVYNEEHYKAFAREKGLATIMDASENAIVVGDSLVKQEERQSGKTTGRQVEADTGESIPLSTAENWLGMAYDNYIKLFPFEKNTPTVLANAGALYYTHNLFNEALKYFKTLTKYFPNSDQIPNVQYSILESYFGKKDYESAEILAKKIIAEGSSEEFKKRAEKRLGEAIFFRAQALADEGKASEAADEFYRMALEGRSVEFVDRALYNAGREYEKAGKYDLAIRSYEMLRVSHSGSSLMPDAMNNLAFDYGEVGEFGKCAERYEALAALLPQGDRAKDALYNAFLFYEKAGNWKKAVEVGRSYAAQYPGAEDAPRIVMRVGEYSLRSEDTENTVAIFSDVAERFPDSPLGVEAYFKLGKYYFDRGIFDEAEQAFQKAFSKSENLKSRGLDENAFYAAEGLFLANRLLHKKFESVASPGLEKSSNRSLEQKQTLLRQLVDQYTKVVSYGTHRLPESIFRIGNAYEQFAYAWANQEIPPMDATARAVKEKGINERTTEIFEEAYTAYRKSVGVLERMLGKTVSSETGGTPSSSNSGDSLAVLTAAWLDSAKVKVSETLYRMAEINSESVDRLLQAPIPADLSGMARLEYRSQVLVRAIKPLLDVVVATHRRNLLVADSPLLRDAWIEASRGKILTSLNLMAREYGQLSFDALDAYKRQVSLYRRTTMNEGRDAPEGLVNSVANLIELSKSYAQATVFFYKEAVEKAVEIGMEPSGIVQSQDDAVRYTLRNADSLEVLIDAALKDQAEAESLFKTKGELRYEEVLASFEDNVYFLKENLKTILDLAYKTEQEYASPSPLGGWISARLVRMDPETYAESLNIPIEEMIVRTDTTWWYTTVFQSEWERLDFLMTDWRRPIRRNRSDDSQNPNRDLQVYGVPPAGGKCPFYVRKEIDVPGYPISGKIVFRADAERFFVNGKPVSEKLGSESITITSFLRQGKNLFAAEYGESEYFSIGGAALIRYIPKRALPDEVK